MKTFDEFWAERGNHVAWADDRKDAARFVWDAARAGCVIDNEAAFDKLLGGDKPQVSDDPMGRLRRMVESLRNPYKDLPEMAVYLDAYARATLDVLALFDQFKHPRRCSHEFDCDQAGANYSIWRCRHCGTERRR